jgi:hypothetical protein
MARRPTLTGGEKIWTRQELKEMANSLAHLSESTIREMYQRAYRECAIINSHTFPAPRAIQELVTAWKQLRKWRR